MSFLMNLKSQLDNRLLEIKQTILKIEEVYKLWQDLVKSFFSHELIDDSLNRDFALKKSAIEKLVKEFFNLVTYYEAFKKYRELILPKERGLIRAINFLDELKDKLIFVLVELKATIIFLENRLK